MSDLAKYWKAYGGLPALISSKYLWGAVALTALISPWWADDDKWPDTALIVLPPLLGFTIGAMAVVLAFPTSKIFRHLAEDGRENSYYAQLAAKLVHFILVQTIGIVLSLIRKALSGSILDSVGVFFLMYATMTAIAIGFALFNMALLYNETADMTGED